MRFYRLLLRLYPSTFRQNYGAELMQAFDEDTRGQSALRRTISAIGDVVPNAMIVHWEILLQDLRFAARSHVRTPSFAITVVLITAIGVGANVATFSVADRVLLRPLSFPNSDEIVRICEGPRTGGGWGCNNLISPPNFRDAVARAKSFQAIGAFQRTAVNLIADREPRRVAAASVSGDVLPLLGVGAFKGRLLQPSDDADPLVAVISHALWRDQFGSDAAIIGRNVRLDGAPYVIVGVMPPHFNFPTTEAKLWRPLVLSSDAAAARTNTILEGVARLRKDVPFDRALTEMQEIAAQLQREYPESNEDTGFSFFRLRDEMSPRFRMILLALCGASLSLLLLAMANLGSLHLTRIAGREKELAVREALGAGRERLLRQLLTESLLLAIIGGVVGVAVAFMTVPLLAHLIPSTLPIASRTALNGPILVVAAVVTAVVGVGIGMIPAARAGRRQLFDTLRSGAGGEISRQRLRRVLMGVEIAVSVVLLTTSAFLVRAVWRVQNVEPGFATEGALAVRTVLPEARYAATDAKTLFYQRVLAEVRSVTGVEAAGFVSGLPMVMTGGITGILMPGEDARTTRPTTVSWRIVTPGYFEALGVKLVGGRDVEWTDDTTRTPAAVVSESFAEEFWPGVDPLGREFVMRGVRRTVVGVVKDIRVRGLERSSEPQMYLPAPQTPEGTGEFYGPKDLVVRARGDLMSLVPTVSAIVRGVDPEQPISDARPLTELVAGQSAERVAQARVLGALALIALLLTGVGIQGLLAYGVAQRSREIGLRLALGAAPRQVAGLVVRESLRLALFGVIPGIAIAYAAVRSMRAMLFGLAPADPWMLAGAAGIVMLVALLGSIAPASRAVRVSPMEAMRGE